MFSRMYLPRSVKTGGEEYLSADINRTLLQKAEEAIDRGVDLELLRFAA